MSTIFKIQEHTLPTCHIREYRQATIEGQDDVLHLAIKQYTPQETFQAVQAVTVIGASANGFPKVRLDFKLRVFKRWWATDDDLGTLRTPLG
nr:abhydrolase domain-containing protein mpah [Quercus suber]